MKYKITNKNISEAYPINEVNLSVHFQQLKLSSKASEEVHYS
jgi:hypothetical protein